MKKTQAPDPALSKAGFEPSSRLCVFLLLALPLALFWPGLVGGKMLWGGDIETLGLPFSLSARRALAAGHWPWWMPELLGGLPGIAGTNLNFMHPVDMAMALLGVPVPATFALDAAIQVAVAGLGCFALARQLGLSRGAALVAGLSFAASGTEVSLNFAGHSNNVKAIALIPWALWGAHKGFTQRSWFAWALGGVALGLQVLAIGLQIYAYTVPAVVALALWLAWSEGPAEPGHGSPWAHALLGLTLMILLGVALSGPQLFLSLQYKPFSWREGFSYEQFTSWSFHPKEAIGWLVPGFFGWRSPTYHGDWLFCLTTEYFGLLPWALAAAAVTAFWRRKPAADSALPLSAQRRRRPELFLLGLAVFGLLAGMGKYFPLHYVFYHLPVYNGFRTWARCLCFLTLTVSLLAGFGWDALQEASPEVRRTLQVWGLFCALIAGLCLWGATGNPEQQGLARSSALKTLGFGLGLAAFFTGAWSRRLGALSLLILALGFHAWDQSDMAQRFLMFRAPQEFLGRPAFLSALPAPGSTQPFRLFDRAGVWQQNAAIIHGYETISGYHGLQMSAPMRLAQALQAKQLDWLRLMNGRYILSREPLNFPGWKPLTSTAPYVYEDPGALPRAYFASLAVTVKDDDEAFQTLAQPGFPVLQGVTVEKALGLDSGAQRTSATFTQSENGFLQIQASNQRPALLVISQNWYPTWSALVDGKPAEILKADGGALQALRLDAGQHQVELRCGPGAAFGAGLVSAALALLLLGGLFWRERQATPH